MNQNALTYAIVYFEGRPLRCDFNGLRSSFTERQRRPRCLRRRNFKLLDVAYLWGYGFVAMTFLCTVESVSVGEDLEVNLERFLNSTLGYTCFCIRYHLFLYDEDRLSEGNSSFYQITFPNSDLCITDNVLSPLQL